MPKIKICGMVRPCDIDYVNEANPDYTGFIFANTRRLITKQQAKEYKSRLNPSIKAVGVFVDDSIQKISEYANEGIIDIIQLHGHEDADYINKLKKNTGCDIIKAIRVTDAGSIQLAKELPADYFLLDAYSKDSPGGTGTSFDWSLICELPKPFFLAGGLNPDNIEAALKLEPFGLDISSGVETNGFKDKNKMIEIVRRIKNV